MIRSVWVSHRFEGWHSWPDAPLGRKYLSDRHRHMFHVQAEAQVIGDDREIEFHDLLDVVALRCTRLPELGSESCEMMAEQIIEAVRIAYPYTGAVKATVSEDGECGSTVAWIANGGEA